MVVITIHLAHVVSIIGRKRLPKPQITNNICREIDWQGIIQLKVNFSLPLGFLYHFSVSVLDTRVALLLRPAAWVNQEVLTRGECEGTFNPRFI